MKIGDIVYTNGWGIKARIEEVSDSYVTIQELEAHRCHRRKIHRANLFSDREVARAMLSKRLELVSEVNEFLRYAGVAE